MVRIVVLLSAIATLTLVACSDGATPAGESYNGPGAKADKADEELLSSVARAVLVSPALLDALDRVQRTWGDDPLAQRDLAISAVSEESDGVASVVQLRLDAAPAHMFPSSFATVGALEARIADGAVRVDFIKGKEIEGKALPPRVAILLGAPSYRTRIRSLLEDAPDLALTDLAELGDSIGAVVVARLRGGAAGSKAARYELVARFATPPESAPKVQSVAAYRDGVIADLRSVDRVDGWQAFPGNGYFAYDDAKALQAFWAGYAKLTGAPVPYIGRGETVVGFATHYSPLTAKDMSVEVIDDQGQEIVVNVTVTWNGFACFEHTGDVDLYNLVKLQSGDRPIVVKVYTDTGEPCDTGVQLPDLPPKLVHELRLAPETLNRITFCESSGKFSDPPFGQGCRLIDKLPTQ